MMDNENKRLQTFPPEPEWASPVKPKELANAGFYSTGRNDEVECFSCHGKLGRWDEGDNPLVEHLKHYGDCDFIKEKKAEVPDGKQYGTTACDVVAFAPASYQHGQEEGTNQQQQQQVLHQTQMSGPLTCMICNNRQREVILEPCSHYVVCGGCARTISSCPQLDCGTIVKGFQ